MNYWVSAIARDELLESVVNKLDSHDDDSLHYENTPMQYPAILHGCKNNNFQLKLFDFIHIFAQNIYCGYTFLEPPH